MMDDQDPRFVSLNLADILREKLDDCAKFKRDLLPYAEVIAASVRGGSLSEGDTQRSVHP